MTLTESIVFLLTGRVRLMVASLGSLRRHRASVPVVPGASPPCVARLRNVPDREIAGLQLRGSARFATYVRSRDARCDGCRLHDRTSLATDRWAVRPAIAWLSIILLALLGSRDLITGGVPRFGQFLAFPAAQPICCPTISRAGPVTG